MVGIVLVAAGVAIGALVFGDDDASDPDGTAKPAEAPTSSTTVPASTTAPPPLTAPPVSLAPSPPMQEVPKGDPERGTRTGSPLDDLPANVRLLTEVGQRPDWSPDGSEIAFIDDSPLGQVWIAEVATGASRNVTDHFPHKGFARAYYLANGAMLLCGPTSGPEPSSERPEAGRFTGVMSVLRAPFDGRPEPLGVPCWEGMATARNSMHIAWNRSDIDYTDPDLVDRVVNGITEIWTGEIRDVDGRATVVNARQVIDRDTFGALAVFEVQAFRPPAETELLLTAYAYQGGEVLGLDLETGTVRNYSNSSAYEETEGVDADGDTVYVERDISYDGITPGALDIWRLDLGDSSWERVTYFNRYAPYYASNPTVAPDGRLLAFQLSFDGETEGQGEGILLLDLAT